MKMLRIDDDVAVIIKVLAAKKGLGLTEYINQHFRSIGSDVEIVPTKTSTYITLQSGNKLLHNGDPVSPKNLNASAQEEFVVDDNFVPPDELPQLPVEPIVTPLSDESTVILDNEKPCCKRNAPCVHWMFDGVNELWKNTLSGRIKEL
jgi:hypothetical protein